MIEFLSLAGLLAVVVLLLRAAWRTIWWRAGFVRPRPAAADHRMESRS